MTTPTSSATNGTQSTAQTNGTSSSSSSSPQDLQNTFLQLLVAQLQNQDPTNPMDSSQMTAQLAEINTVSGISQLNTTLSSLAGQLSAGQNAELIGQYVLSSGTTTTVSSGASPGFGVTLPSNVTDLQVQFTNADGQVVSTVDYGAQQAGTFPLAWKATDASGNALPDGTYTVTAMATTSSGQVQEQTLSMQKVAGVAQENGSYQLVLQNGSTIPESSVAMIL